MSFFQRILIFIVFCIPTFIFNCDNDCRSRFYYSLFFQLFKKKNFFFSSFQLFKICSIFPFQFSKLVQYFYCYRWQSIICILTGTTTVGRSSSIHFFFFSLLKKNFQNKKISKSNCLNRIIE